MEQLITELLKTMGPGALVVAVLIYGLKYFMKKNEELFTALNESHKERDAKFIDLINNQNQAHNKCTENYLQLSGKLEEVIRNNTEAISEIREIVEKK